jgi:DNA-binding protein YbaB
MSNAGYDLIRQAADELDRRQQRLHEIRGELAKTSTKVSSADRSVTVELNATGELASIKFNSQRYRRMAPAELSAVLVETITRARAESRERFLGAYKDLLPAGLSVGEARNGKPDLDRLFDDARREAGEIVAGLRAPDRGRVPARTRSADGPAS